MFVSSHCHCDFLGLLSQHMTPFWPTFNWLYNTLVYRGSHELAAKKSKSSPSPLCLTVGMRRLCWYAVVGFCQTFPLWSDLSKGLATCPSFCFYRDFYTRWLSVNQVPLISTTWKLRTLISHWSSEGALISLAIEQHWNTLFFLVKTIQLQFADSIWFSSWHFEVFGISKKLFDI